MKNKTILITGSTDGIGLVAATKLVSMGHTVLIHGRNAEKLAKTEQLLLNANPSVSVEIYRADLSSLNEVESLAEAVTKDHQSLDVLINNAGVFSTPNPRTSDDLDVRFVVNTISPFLLTHRLLPMMNDSGRVINLSSAAQAPVNIPALKGQENLSESAAYAQSKLAITAWSFDLAEQLRANGTSVIAVNPGSLLGTKMVKEAYGRNGADINIGADILIKAALSEEFESASGQYFDNDSGRFATPHQDALSVSVRSEIVDTIQAICSNLSHRVDSPASTTGE
ncbi:MAG: SDR family NAD(P)-dependent oxidoreductase [Phycisphaerales bacterium]|nr:SDR family NAD(P)-dependent oxidoreductase [Phycisphaerales bacterium]